jgi:hypothetical protein
VRLPANGRVGASWRTFWLKNFRFCFVLSRTGVGIGSFASRQKNKEKKEND